MSDTPRPSEHWAPRFFTIWTGQAFSLLGSQLVQFALIWWLTLKTGSPTVLTTAALVGLVPQILLGPVAGALVDRWNRRMVMMVADSIIALATLGLAFLYAAGIVEVWHVYALMFIRSVAGGFHWPAMTATTSLMVPNQHLSRIQGLNQLMQGVVGIGGAPLGALLLAVMPIQGILWIDVITALMAVSPLLFIAVPQPPRQTAANPSEGHSLIRELKAGLNYVGGWPGLMLILIMATVINLLMTPAFALLPILVTQYFGGQAQELAWLEAAWGGGMIAGSLLLSIWGGFRRRIMTSMVGLIVLGISSLVVGVAPAWAYLAAVAAMFVGGVGQPITNGPLLAVVQGVVAPDMQGRVFTLIQSAAMAMTPLGLVIAGPLAGLMGVQTWFVLGGVITGAMGIAGFFIPALMNIEEDRRAQHPSPVPALPAIAPASVEIEML